VWRTRSTLGGFPGCMNDLRRPPTRSRISSSRVLRNAFSYFNLPLVLYERDSTKGNLTAVDETLPGHRNAVSRRHALRSRLRPHVKCQHGNTPRSQPSSHVRIGCSGPGLTVCIAATPRLSPQPGSSRARCVLPKPEWTRPSRQQGQQQWSASTTKNQPSVRPV